MSNLVAISTEAHADVQWSKPTNFLPAAQEVIVPIDATELYRAAVSLPLAFIPTNGAFQLSAVLGLESGQSLLVAPDGQWLGDYIPAAIRTYPFRLATTPEGKTVVCIFEEYLGTQNGEALFNPDGGLCTIAAQVVDLLTQIENRKPLMIAACDALQKLNLIVPWEIVINAGDNQRKVEGLYKIDEAALTELDDEPFLTLRKSGALIMAFNQLMSMQHLQKLAKYNVLQAGQKAAPANLTSGKELDLQFLTKGDTIKFN